MFLKIREAISERRTNERAMSSTAHSLSEGFSRNWAVVSSLKGIQLQANTIQMRKEFISTDFGSLIG
jgi:hypothetical protein